MVDEGKTNFYDGMRVSREHLSHMEELLLDAIRDIRATIGLGKICWGFKVTLKDSSSIEVGEGLAFDKEGRRIHVKEPQILQISLSEESKKYLIIWHKLEKKKLQSDAIETIIEDSFDLSIVDSPEPEDKDSIIIALIKKKDEGIEVDQSTAPYITAIDHAHSGKLIETDKRLVFDGRQIYPSFFPEPDFDSDFIFIENGESKKIVHNLKSYGLLVQIMRKSDEIKNLNNKMGYWYELHDSNSIVIHNDIDPALEKNVLFRVLIWKFGAEVEEVRVPRLLGMTKEEAGEALSAAGLILGKVTTREVEDEKVEKVVEQNPSENSPVILKTPVDMVVGKQRKEEKVPDVINLTKYKAEKILDSSGWRYKFTPTSIGEHAGIGRVLEQDPAPATSADRDKVEIVLSIALYNFEVEAIEGIGETFGKRFRELDIDTLGKLSVVDENKIKIKGVSGERLLIWKYMANLMTTIENLDGNGAEIFVRCKNIKTPDELAAISIEQFQQFYDECIDCSKKIKIPRDYIKNYFTQQNVKKWIEAASQIINP